MIKKMITAAALIAAGTAFASADTSGWTSLQLTQTSIDSGRKTLGELGMTQDYNYAEYSWCVSFTLDISESRNTGLSTFTTNTYNGTCLMILTNTSNGVINIAGNSGEHFGYPNSTSSTPVFTVGGSDLSITLDWDAELSTMSLRVYQDGMEETYVTTWTPTTEDADGNTHENYLQYASLTTDSTFLTHQGDSSEYTTPFSDIAVYVRAVPEVPEPSMFGVLAGLGALGLVATRRRRNRKA